MAICQNVSPKHRKLCAGDLNNEIQVLTRDLIPPVSGDPDYTVEVDSDIAPIVFCSIRTTNGQPIFDGTGTNDVQITHIFGVYFDESFTSENVVLFEDNLYQILSVEDLEERHEWMFLYCVISGTTNNASSFG